MKKTVFTMIFSILMSNSVLGMGTATAVTKTSESNLVEAQAVHEDKEEIFVSSRKGYIFEMNGADIEIQKEVEKINSEIQKLPVDEVEMKLKSENYMERVWANFFYLRAKKGKEYIEISLPGENDWDGVIDKLIIDIKLLGEQDSYLGLLGFYEAMMIFIMSHFGETLLDYFDKNQPYKYHDPKVRYAFIKILFEISKNREDLKLRIIEFIVPFQEDKNNKVQKTAEDILKIIEGKTEE